MTQANSAVAWLKSKSWFDPWFAASVVVLIGAVVAANLDPDGAFGEQTAQSVAELQGKTLGAPPPDVAGMTDGFVLDEDGNFVPKMMPDNMSGFGQPLTPAFITTTYRN